MRAEFFLVLVVGVCETLASVGDRSYVFGQCTRVCFEKQCRKHDNYTTFESQQAFYMRLLRWSCLDECRYNCMWQTVEYFVEVEKRGVPQFYGKWPFVRLAGLQEPVSCFASLLNFLAHAFMLKKLRQKMSRNAPFGRLWLGFGFFSLNAWFWSTVFHARDFDFTEKMDYFCGFSLVLYQFNAFFVRLFLLKKSPLFRQFIRMISLCSIFYYAYHVYYLSFVRFDYGYNMQVNILFGALNSLCWLFWSIHGYFQKRQRYLWRCFASVLLVDIFMGLEVFDFSPILWSVDSHALWHISTICIPFLWYRFLIDDNDRVYHEIIESGDLKDLKLPEKFA